MGVTKNRTLLEWIFPIDNAYPENIELGAYHFRQVPMITKKYFNPIKFILIIGFGMPVSGLTLLLMII